MTRYCLLFFCFLRLSLSVFASSPVPIGPAKVDPRLHWKTLETDHFSIHFYQGEEELARRTAFLAEKIHTRLTHAMQWNPGGKTELVINDSIDIVNGVATPFLYNQIFIYPTLPVLELGHFDDWMGSLLTHEYTHILDLGRVEGFAKGIGSVFGRIWFPKAFASSLFTEGYATYTETSDTNGGRGRDPYTEMFLREAFLADDVPTLDELLFWGVYPGGSNPYTYGSALFRFMSETYGDSSPHLFQRNLAGELWPWNAGNAARISTGNSLRGLWERWKERSIQRYREQEAAIRQKGVTVSQPLTSSKSGKWGPTWSPDGETLYYFDAGDEAHPEIRRIDRRLRRESSVIHIHTLTDETGLALSPDGTQLVFSQIGFQRSFSVYNDLWIRDVQSGKTRRLTNGARLKDPAWSPDGKSILAVKNERGTTRLALIRPPLTEIRLLNPGMEPLGFSEPAWAPDGDHFAASVWQEGGYQNIWVFDATGQTAYPILHDRSWDISPCWTPDGKYVVFSSDRTGVYNLFAYQLETGQLYQLTNVLGGAFSPSVSPDGSQIGFVNYSNNGFNIHTMTFHPEAWRPFAPPSGNLFFLGYRTTPSVPKLTDNQTPPYRIHAYHSLSTLTPRFWLPYPTADESGVAIGAITGGRDVLGKHTYVAAAQYGVVSNKPSYTFEYINDQFYPSFTLSLWDMPAIVQFQNRSRNDFFTWRRSRGASAQIYLPYTTAKSQQGFNLGIEIERSTFQNWPARAPLPFSGHLVDAFIGWHFDNTHRYRRAISRTDGVDLAMTYREFLTQLGSEVNLSAIAVDAQVYIGMPAHRHVLAWKGSLAYNTGNFPIFQPQFNALTLRSFDDLYVGNLFFSTGEYRFPIVEIQHGWQSIPIFLEQLHGAVFADFARVLSSPPNNQLAIGGELRLDGALAYSLQSTLRLSFALKTLPERGARVLIQVGEAF